jgi:proteasome lid subunit RPN8/RPN11
MIVLSLALKNRMFTHVESTYPEEGCGLLLGELTETEVRAIEVWRTDNAWTGDKRKHFSIAPEVMLQVQKEARNRCLEIIGIYHSHPDHPAIPSEIDRQLAWTGYSYLIVSVIGGKAIETRSWRLDEEQKFQEEAIEIL